MYPSVFLISKQVIDGKIMSDMLMLTCQLLAGPNVCFVLKRGVLYVTP